MGIVLIILSVLLQFVLPILITLQVRRRFDVSWSSMAMGLLAYMGSTVVYGLLLSLLLQTDIYKSLIQSSAVVEMLFTLLLSCLFQVGALVLVFRYAGKDKVLPAGMLGIAVGYAVINVLLASGLGEFLNLTSMIMSSVTGPDPSLTAEQLAATQAAIASYWNPPAYFPILTTVIAFSSMALYLSQLGMAWIGYVYKKWQWLVASVLWGTALLAISRVSVAWLRGVIDPYTGASKVNDPWYVAVIFFVLAVLQYSLLYAFWKKIYPVVSDELKDETAAYKEALKLENARRAAQASSRPAQPAKGSKASAAPVEKKPARPARLDSGTSSSQPSGPVEVKATKATKPTKLPKKD